MNVFEQCQSLLSPMHHYDFQLRTALATINEAVALRGANSTAEENEIVGRSIRHVLSPYVVNSVRLFLYIRKSNIIINFNDFRTETYLNA